jgi:DNA-binding Lrp family transcriptional regulator
MAAETRELILYIQSKKAVTTFYQRPVVAPGVAGGFGAATATRVGGAPSSAGDVAATSEDRPVYFLSDDQSRAMALTEELAKRRGYRLKIIDIEKAGRLERLVTEHLRGVQTLPVLIGPGDQRLVGCEQFTEENIAALMPTELQSVRALSYLKVHGGDLDRIRRLLEGFPEVKELHFLTGDWDILVVLEFPPTTTNKRRVLDFVTERIRGIPEIIDTSTLVPEYSVTKFP